MQVNSNSLMDTYQQQMDASREVAGAAFDVADRMEQFMLGVARKAFDERLRFYQSLSKVRAPQDVLAFQAEFLSHTPERLLELQQEWMQLVAQSQEQIGNAAQHYKDGLNGSANGRLTASQEDDASHPNGGLTSMFTMWDKAFKDTVAMATGGMASALAASQNGNATEDAVQKPARRRGARAK